MIEKLDASIPRNTDLAPGMPGNRSAEQEREVRAKLNECIELINKLNQPYFVMGQAKQVGFICPHCNKHI